MNKKEFVVVLTITFIVFMVWIISDIIHTKSTTPQNPKLKTILEPVNPILDAETLKLLDAPPIINLQTLPNSSTSATPLSSPPTTFTPNTSTSSANQP